MLQGAYCHVCGQRSHNPLRSFRHAVEEVFESLWHLDGRIFRTLRGLFVPGRVATDYLAGHRVRYIAPLRLFVILSLITFFVGKLTLNIFDGDASARGASGPNQPRASVMVGDQRVGESQYLDAKTVEDVIAIHAATLKDTVETPASSIDRFFVDAFGGAAEAVTTEAALKRLRELGATPEQIRTIETASATTKARISSDTAGVQAAERGILGQWLAHRAKRIRSNVSLAQDDPDKVFKQFLGAIPGALFLLVPVFALFLKLFYIRSGRGYLEHLVVALYSHAFMLMALLVLFVLTGMQAASWRPDWARIPIILCFAAINLGTPFYLLLMQKRVYAQGWIKTLLKYLLLGSIYSILLVFGIIYAGFAGLSN